MKNNKFINRLIDEQPFHRGMMIKNPSIFRFGRQSNHQILYIRKILTPEQFEKKFKRKNPHVTSYIYLLYPTPLFSKDDMYILTHEQIIKHLRE